MGGEVPISIRFAWRVVLDYRSAGLSNATEDVPDGIQVVEEVKEVAGRDQEGLALNDTFDTAGVTLRGTRPRPEPEPSPTEGLGEQIAGKVQFPDAAYVSWNVGIVHERRQESIPQTHAYVPD